MRKFLIFLLLLTVHFSFAQTQSDVARPKLVVGIVIDQMRWDYLYRYYDVYKSNGGFKRLLGEGFTCENTFIPYTPTVTAAGHTCVYTGSVPAVHGIVGNNWYDNVLKKGVYCTDDDSVQTVGSTTPAGKMSPKNMFATTMGDELRLATNFKNKVVGVAIKDRGAILPAGHAATAAYWYDYKTGDFITSTYYMNALPQWVQNFNARKIVDSLYKLNWNTLYPIQTYVQSDSDDKIYEGKSSYDSKPVFPHMTNALGGTNYLAIAATPHGNTMTAEFVKAAIQGEGMGVDDITDFLAVSFSSPDYIGHQYGPNSIEIEDTYLRLDKEFAALFSYLDSKFGNQYTVFLTADHAVANAPGYAKENKLPGGAMSYYNSSGVAKTIDKFGLKKIIEASANNQLYLNRKAIDSANLNFDEVKKYLLSQLNQDPGIFYAFDNANINNAILPTEVKEKFLKGMNVKRGGDVQVILPSGYMTIGTTGTTHGSWYPYDSHIPVIFMGWGIKQGRTTRDVFMTDIAPTISALLKIQMPSGNIGKTVGEALK